MENTYEILKPLARLYDGDGSDEQLIEDYIKEDTKPLVLAYIYCKNYGLFYKTASKFTGTTQEDKESYIVECIDKAITSYDNTKGAKLLTYINKFVYNRAREEYSRSKKGSLIALTDSVRFESVETNDDYNTENYMDTLIGGEEDYDYNAIETLEYLKSLKLTDREIRYCELIIKEGSYTDVAAAEALGLSASAIYDIRVNLQKKLGKSSTSIKDTKKTRKLTNELKLDIVKEVLQGKWKTKAAAATYYGVDGATIGDLFSPKYCSAKLRDAVKELISSFGDDALKSKWGLAIGA